jgi:hypothetical protein
MKTNSQCTEEAFGKFHGVSRIFLFYYFPPAQSFLLSINPVPHTWTSLCYQSRLHRYLLAAPRILTSHESRHFTLPLELGCRMFRPHMTLCSLLQCRTAGTRASEATGRHAPSSLWRAEHLHAVHAV